MGYIDNFTGKVWDWTKPFQRTNKFPLDRSSMFASYEDALLYAKGDGSDSRGLGATSYIGQTITVWGLNEKGKDGVWVYSLVPTEKEGFAAELKPVGSTQTETAETYSAAKTLSEGLVVGQLILVSKPEDIEETVNDATVTNTYQAGFYIVNAPGSISALDTSSGASDEIGAISGRVTSLEGKVTTLEGNRVLTSDFDTYKQEIADALAGKVDNDAFTTYKGEISTALDAKVDDSEFATYKEGIETYKGEVTNALDAKVDDSVFEAYQGEMTNALDAKVDDSEFTTYKEGIETYKGEVTEQLNLKATNADLQELTGKVNTDIQKLTNHLTDYANNLEQVDGRIDTLEAFVEGHIGHGRIEDSEIEGLFTQPQE